MKNNCVHLIKMMSVHLKLALSKAAVVCILSVHLSFALFHKGRFTWLMPTVPKCIKKEQRRIMRSSTAINTDSQFAADLAKHLQWIQDSSPDVI